MKNSEDVGEETSTGCALYFFVFVLCVFIAIFIAYRCDNEAYENLVAENKQLLSQNFEVKEIFIQRHGNKPANIYWIYMHCRKC